MILISSCLLGLNCKYNGGNNYNEKIFELLKNKEIIPVCPEQLGGLQTPRVPAEIRYIDGERYVYSKDNIDVTNNFERGAKEVLELSKRLGIKKAILKARSPSCGHGKIYNGMFKKELVDGNGVLAQLLIDNGIEVISDEEYLEQMEKK